MPDKPKMSATWKVQVEKRVEQLVEGGCKRKVLYWCLSRLTLKAERERAGEVRHIEALDDSPVKSRTSQEKLPTREHMKGVSNQLEAALGVIQNHQGELLMASEVLGHSLPLPKGGILFDSPPTDIDAMLMLMSSLAWAKKLSDSWQGLNEKQWVKSMGSLYLLEYVWLCTKSPEKHWHPKKAGVQRKKTKLTRIDAPYAMEIAWLVDLYWKDLKSPSHVDLIDKRQDFQTK